MIRKLALPRFLIVLPPVALMIWAVAACGGGTAASTPEDVLPSPTAEAITSPSSPTEETFTSPLSPSGETSISPLAPPGTLPPLALEPGFGGAAGVIATVPPDWSGQALFVYFAPFYPEEAEGGGIFVLEPSVHPSSEVNPGGAFQIGNIPPARYVIVVGPTAEDALAILDGDHPRIFEILEGRVLELGDVELEW